jgi:hypothetical protein
VLLPAKEYSYVELIGPPEVAGPAGPAKLTELVLYRLGSRRLVFAEEFII